MSTVQSFALRQGSNGRAQARPIGALLFPALFAAALPRCHDAPAAADVDSSLDAGSLGGAALAGRVVDENAAPIPHATLTWARGTVAETADDGYFTLAFGSRETAIQPLKISAPGFATIFRTYGPAAGTTLTLGDLVLRRQMPAQTAMLPAPGATAVPVERTTDDGGIKLLLEAGKLVDSAGRLVTGEVDVHLEYWHPESSLRSAPASLRADNGNETLPLDCFGMAGIEVWQGGEALAVATGQDLTVEFKQPKSRQAFWRSASPQLYALDEVKGLWRQEGTVADGRLAFDPETQAATAKLGHLSYWNVDYAMNPNNGGCVGGVAYNACDFGSPARNTDVTVWFLSWEQLADFPTRTDSNGSYCVATPIPDAPLVHNQELGLTGVHVHYIVTGKSMEDTDMANPLPPSCRTCDPEMENRDEWGRRCNDCVLDVPDYQFFPTGDQVKYHDTTPPPGLNRVSLESCSFCLGKIPADGVCTSLGSEGRWQSGRCPQLVPVHLKPPGCSCMAIGHPCTAGSKCCATGGKQAYCSSGTGLCTACGPPKRAFDLCGSDQPCCSALGEPRLVCLDNVCLPEESVHSGGSGQ